MNDTTPFPDYIQRGEEERIRHEAALVKQNRESRAVMLYGAGGVGKTWLVRELVRTSYQDPEVVWLEPMDIDDSEYWLLYSLEQKVAKQLDPGNRYFEPYRDHVARIPQLTQPATTYAAIVSQLGRIKDVFLECYKEFVEGTGKTVVVSLDTVEAIRGTYLLTTLTRWMKALPATLFILSGRPTSAEIQDPIRRELESGLPLIRIDLGRFTEATAHEYLNKSGAAQALSPEEKDKVVHLTRGHPLWLAFALGFLMEIGVPQEAEGSLRKITADMPFQDSMTPKGQALHESFKRRLVSQYKDAYFWPEAIKCLAVVRERVNQPIWQRLMSDVELPADVGSWDKAWELLLEIPWIRPRSNNRYVTLHDALAEELALRIIPVHDQDQQMRRKLWRRAVEICAELTERLSAGLGKELEKVLRELEESEVSGRTSAALQEIADLDADKREIDQLKTSHLYYQLLSDPEKGYRLFLALLEQSREEHDVLFQQLIALEMHRFLPTRGHPHQLGDVTHEAIEIFQAWLHSNPEAHLEVTLKMADYLLANEQAESAMDLLEAPLPLDLATPDQRNRLNVLRGNASMRTPGRVKKGEQYFLEALDQAHLLDPERRSRAVAEAYKELGYYYRNAGLWVKADKAYSDGHRELSETLTLGSPADDREEMASIQSNWAYVKALLGSHREAHNLVESAIAIRHKLGRKHEEGISWSICGEVNRYDRQYREAWKSYGEAERIFNDLRSWSWLGVIYQEQAICLFAAAETGLNLVQDENRDPAERAEALIAQALDICREQGIRNYPSALLRAGRIFGKKDFDRALGYLEEGILQARQLSDGWFWFASLIEYVEVSYQAWIRTGRQEYRERLDQRGSEIREVMAQYDFPHHRGRWEILQGHLHARDALASRETSELSHALEHYKLGFPQITGGYVGGYGRGSIPTAFSDFAKVFEELPTHTQEGWINELRLAWQGETSLLARLEDLY